MAYRGYCREDKGCLFDVPNFEAFSEKEPIILTCQHCQRRYHVSQDAKGDIVYRLMGSSLKRKPIKAEKYG